MNKQQRFESRIIKKQSKETGYTYKEIKRKINRAIRYWQGLNSKELLPD